MTYAAAHNPNSIMRWYLKLRYENRVSPLIIHNQIWYVSRDLHQRNITVFASNVTGYQHFIRSQCWKPITNSVRDAKQQAFLRPTTRPKKYVNCRTYVVFRCGWVAADFTYILQGYFTGSGTTWRFQRTIKLVPAHLLRNIFLNTACPI